jgi:hypothetical protein
LNMLGHFQLPNKKSPHQLEKSEQLHMYALNGLYCHSHQYLPLTSKALEPHKTMNTRPQKAYGYFECN